MVFAVLTGFSSQVGVKDRLFLTDSNLDGFWVFMFFFQSWFVVFGGPKTTKVHFELTLNISHGNKYARRGFE